MLYNGQIWYAHFALFAMKKLHAHTYIMLDSPAYEKRIVISGLRRWNLLPKSEKSGLFSVSFVFWIREARFSP